MSNTKIRLDCDSYDLSSMEVAYPKGTCFTLLSDEGSDCAYVMAETLDKQEVIAIDYGEFTILE